MACARKMQALIKSTTATTNSTIELILQIQVGKVPTAPSCCSNEAGLGRADITSRGRKPLLLKFFEDTVATSATSYWAFALGGGGAFTLYPCIAHFQLPSFCLVWVTAQKPLI